MTTLTKLEDGSAVATFEEFYIYNRRLYQMHELSDPKRWMDYNKSQSMIKVEAEWRNGK